MKHTIIISLLILSTNIFSAEFTYKSENVTTLYGDAIEYINNKQYKKAIIKLEKCENTTRCSSKLIELYSTVAELKDLSLVERYSKIYFELGNDKAYHNLALLYYKEGKIEKAKEYFVKSGDAKVYESLFNLGKIYEKEKKIAMATEEYKIASKHNINEADYSLGVLYYNKNLDKSLHYFNKAAKQGYKPAIEAIESISKARK